MKQADLPDRIQRAIERTTKAATAAHEFFKAEPRTQDVLHEIECPICKGRLYIRQASHNGHVWGQCETEGCVSWME